MKHLCYICTGILLLFLFSCKSSKPASTEKLAQHKWVLSELNGAPVQMSNTNKDANLQFDYKEMRISGNGGCNGISGTFTSTRTKLLFGPVLATKMACPNVKFEDNFLLVLAQVNRYEITATELLLKNNTRIIARLLPK